jgi:hypothetical protein
LKFMLVMKNFRIVLWFMRISTLILILLIYNFCSWPLCKTLICFQLHPSIPICDMLFFFNLVIILLIVLFWVFFVKLIFLFNFTFQSKFYFYFYISILIFILLIVLLF